jgi:hypothetical protein
MNPPYRDQMVSMCSEFLSVWPEWIFRRSSIIPSKPLVNNSGSMICHLRQLGSSVVLEAITVMCMKPQISHVTPHLQIKLLQTKKIMIAFIYRLL